MAKPLIQTNPYLRDAALRHSMLRRNAIDSSIFEGASGLPKINDRRRIRQRVHAIAAARKSVSGS